MPRPAPIDRDQRHRIPTDRNIVRHPDRHADGSPVREQPHRAAPRDSAVVDETVRSPAIIEHADRIQREEHRYQRDHYYWYQHGGARYCHYYDAWGHHWFGFYVGSHYYWTRWHYGRFWWLDPIRFRWIYWSNGYWWWQDPGSDALYIYIDGTFFHYIPGGGGVIIRPEPAPGPAPAPEESAYYSEDGTRVVEVFGKEKDAFLYDTAEPASFEPKYLGSDVKEVIFSHDAQPLRILLVIEKEIAGPDGQPTIERSLKLFDGFGEELAPVQPPAPPAPALGLGQSPAFQQLLLENPEF